MCSTNPMPAMHNMIPVSPCLCSEYEKGDSCKYVVEAKVDGMRVIVKVTGNEVGAWTRNGRAIELPVNAVVDAIDIRDRNCHLGDTLVLDCELTSDRLWLLDLPLVDGNYRVRRTALEALFWNIAEDHYGCIRLVPVLHDPELDNGYPEDIDTLVNLARRERFEGIVLKDPEAGYEQGARSWFKVKPTRTLDLMVKAVKSNGSLVVEHSGVDVTVGIGLSDALRRLSIANPSAVIGSIIEVRFQEETVHGSLRHPVFVRERNDKDTVDTI